MPTSPHAPITRESLLTLEAYARQRKEFRARVIAHKKDRTWHVGPAVLLLFEDELTVRYQIQEMLRIEKTFEEQGIVDELDAYLPLVPDGRNLKATMMIEYDDPLERKRELVRLKGIEDRLFLQVDAYARVFAVADEDMERENEVKTSAVHFLRFEFTDAMVAAWRGGAAVAAGSDHPAYAYTIDEISPVTQMALACDFAG
jgi:hypothetical protein